MSSNRVLQAWREASAALDSIPLDSYTALSSAELIEVIQIQARHEARVSAHRFASARAVADSDAVRDHGASSAGSLFANAFGGDRSAGDRLAHKAKRMGNSPSTEQALSRGLLSAGQADVISTTLANLP